MPPHAVKYATSCSSKSHDGRSATAVLPAAAAAALLSGKSCAHTPCVLSSQSLPIAGRRKRAGRTIEEQERVRKEMEETEERGATSGTVTCGVHRECAHVDGLWARRRWGSHVYLGAESLQW